MGHFLASQLYSFSILVYFCGFVLCPSFKCLSHSPIFEPRITKMVGIVETLASFSKVSLFFIAVGLVILSYLVSYLLNKGMLYINQV